MARPAPPPPTLQVQRQAQLDEVYVLLHPRHAAPDGPHGHADGELLQPPAQGRQAAAARRRDALCRERGLQRRRGAGGCWRRMLLLLPPRGERPEVGDPAGCGERDQQQRQRRAGGDPAHVRCCRTQS
jgi:hypothetical protein